ncbi:MAG: hypothetical protein ACE5HE_06905 [Phycisphaerae bacterium]
MDGNLAVLCGTALSVGFVHTLLGPDHYLPFVALSRIRGWSLKKTAFVTLLCGMGHVLSSVVLGVIGITFGVAVLKLERIEQYRGELAGWLLLAFGLVYFVWGVRRGICNRPHIHRHAHADGTLHTHEHAHFGGHAHVHVGPAERRANTSGDAAKQTDSVTPWVLFTVFLFGPCEPLIPLLMYPAAKGRMSDVVVVATLFGVTTLATMTTIVLLSCAGVSRAPFEKPVRYGHALAGLVLVACGAAVKAGW